MRSGIILESDSIEYRTAEKYTKLGIKNTTFIAL